MKEIAHLGGPTSWSGFCAAERDLLASCRRQRQERPFMVTLSPVRRRAPVQLLGRRLRTSPDGTQLHPI